jgi:hypothetical protein
MTVQETVFRQAVAFWVENYTDRGIDREWNQEGECEGNFAS